MPLTNYGEQQVLQQIFGTPSTLVLPASAGNWYLGLLSAKWVWASGTTGVAQGDLVIPPNFSTYNNIYKVTSAGASQTMGSTTPSWQTNAAAATSTVTDGTITYTPVAWQAASTASTTSYYIGTNVLGGEVTPGTSYARATLTNTTGITSSTSTFFTPSLPTGTGTPYYASTYYNNTVSFTQSSGSWGNVCGFFLDTTGAISPSGSGSITTTPASIATTLSPLTLGYTSAAGTAIINVAGTATQISYTGVTSSGFTNASVASGSVSYTATSIIGGNAIAWNTLTNYVPVTVSGITVQITSGSTGLQIQLT